MSDEHSGLSHDMPEYVPNWPVASWPVPAKVKASVYQGGDGLWYWAHNCPRKAILRRYALGRPRRTQAEAFAEALKHVQGCW